MLRSWKKRVVDVVDVVEVRIAYFRVCIPSVHRIDGLRQLCAASLVDTTSVDPRPLVPILLRLLTGIQYLLVAKAATNFILLLPIHLY